MGSKVSLLAHNLYLFNQTEQLVTGFDSDLRIGAIVRHCRHSDADLLALCEVWSNEHRIALMKHLGDLFPYSDHGPLDQSESFVRGLLGRSDGLLLLSRRPFDGPLYFQAYKSESGWDSWKSKGFILARIQFGDTVLHLVTTHTQADHSSKEERVRRDQFGEISAALDRFSTERGKPTLEVVAGDLNVPFANASEYTDMLRILGGFRDPSGVDVGVPTYSKDNYLQVGLEGTDPDMRLDYVLLRGPVTASETRVLRPKMKLDEPIVWCATHTPHRHPPTNYGCRPLEVSEIDLSDHYPIQANWQT